MLEQVLISKLLKRLDEGSEDLVWKPALRLGTEAGRWNDGRRQHAQQAGCPTPVAEVLGSGEATEGAECTKGEGCHTTKECPTTGGDCQSDQGGNCESVKWSRGRSIHDAETNLLMTI